ncbi:MAG: HAD family hydrolase, partial [Actinomycetota bacterium]
MEAAFFDLDKTLISTSSSLALSRPLYRAGMVSRAQLLRGAYGQLAYVLLGADEGRMERMRDRMLMLSRGWDRGEVEDLVRDVIVDLVDPYVYQEGLDLLAEHRAAGRRTFIVSSSPEEIVRPLAAHFGVEDVLATRARIVDGRYTGDLDFYCAGPGKAEAMRDVAEREDIDLAASFAYSDSIADLPMLKAVGHPFAVNPDRDLRREAEASGWPVLAFERPVRLRTRIARTAAEPRAQATAGVIAGITAAAVVGWMLVRARRTRHGAGGTGQRP